jgi:hypothetical protein
VTDSPVKPPDLSFPLRHFIFESFESLQRYIAADEASDVTWAAPVAKLAYDVPWEVDDADPAAIEAAILEVAERAVLPDLTHGAAYKLARDNLVPCLSNDQEEPAPADVVEQAARTWRDQYGAKHVLVVVDSVHSWAGVSPVDFASEYESLNARLRDLHNVAEALVAPVFGGAEHNRGSMAIGGLNAAAGTRKFEQRTETVLDLHREDDATEDANDEYAVTLKVAKNRNGAPGKEVDRRFHGARQQLREP